ncbi:MAG: glycosyltransferase family 39 protein [Xanthomonadales bacterium]|nr:glycosyltransferase family 39 protein [Xanthomonadales bacterium]
MDRRAFLIAWSLLALAKLVLAVALPLFGDEAFYAWESRHPAWSYSDLPPLTAWLMAVGRLLLPDELGVRLPFLLLGLALPWQVQALAARQFGEATGWRAGGLALLLPVAAALGVLALPDVPLAVISVAVAATFQRALAGAGLRAWLALGGWLAVGLLCHYRFGLVLVALAVTTLLLPAGRASLRGPGPWAAAALAALGLLPLLVFNLAHGLAGLRFQVLDRHPWQWQDSAWLQPLEQALVVGPVLVAMLLVAALRAARRPLASAQVPALLALVLLAVVFGLGSFADAQRFRWHWPLPAWLWLVPVLARDWPAWSPWLRRAAVATSGLLAALVLAWLAGAAVPGQSARLLAGKGYPANFSGWREAAGWVAPIAGQGGLLAADNFMLAAALAFYLPEDRRGPLYVLDDPANAWHGRAAQLEIWGVDEAALAASGEGGWLLAEETARRFSDRHAWYRDLCQRFSGLRLDGQLSLDGGRKRFVRWHFESHDADAGCRQAGALPPLGWFELPRRLPAGSDLAGFGWVIQAGLGIEAVEVLVDGRAVARLPRTVEVAWPRERWGAVGDPAGDRVGVEVRVPAAALAPGRRRIELVAVRADGLRWSMGQWPVQVAH